MLPGNKVTKNIKVYVEPKLIIPVKQSNLRILEKDALEWVVRPLAQTYETKLESIGFTEAGKFLVVKMELNVDKEELKDIEVSIDNDKLLYYDIYDTNKDLAIKLQIPTNLKTTLYGEYSLRQKQDSYFNLSRNDIGTRKEAPHILRIKFKVYDREYIEEIRFDTLDTYLSNVNTKVGRTTAYGDDACIKLKDWILLNDE